MGKALPKGWQRQIFFQTGELLKETENSMDVAAIWLIMFGIRPLEKRHGGPPTASQLLESGKLRGEASQIDVDVAGGFNDFES